MMIYSSGECNPDSTILLDYREIGMDTTGLVGGWVNLAVIPAQEDRNSIQNIIFTYVGSEDVQFRFIQFVHGGMECNCWQDIQLLQIRDDDDDDDISTIQLHRGGNTCVRTGDRSAYCGGAVNETRGLITRVVYSDGSSGNNNNRCPGDSSNQNILLPAQGHYH